MPDDQGNGVCAMSFCRRCGGWVGAHEGTIVPMGHGLCVVCDSCTQQDSQQQVTTSSPDDSMGPS